MKKFTWHNIYRKYNFDLLTIRERIVIHWFLWENKLIDFKGVNVEWFEKELKRRELGNRHKE